MVWADKNKDILASIGYAARSVRIHEVTLASIDVKLTGDKKMTLLSDVSENFLHFLCADILLFIGHLL